MMKEKTFGNIKKLLVYNGTLILSDRYISLTDVEQTNLDALSHGVGGFLGNVFGTLGMKSIERKFNEKCEFKKHISEIYKLEIKKWGFGRYLDFKFKGGERHKIFVKNPEEWKKEIERSKIV